MFTPAAMIFDLDTAIQTLVERLGRHDPETVKFTGIYRNLIRTGPKYEPLTCARDCCCDGAGDAVAGAAGAGAAEAGAGDATHARGSATPAPHRPRQRRRRPCRVVAASGTSDAAVAPAEGGSKLLKPTPNGGLRELSPWSMFLSADVLVKAVMVGLAFASLVTWTIFIAKMIELTFSAAQTPDGACQDQRRALAGRSSVRARRQGRRAVVIARGCDARGAAVGGNFVSDAGIKERAASSFAEIVRAEARRIRLGMGLLATIGATSPFVGLFGTVWGIMNSFIGISKSQTTNLAVVAPGIAEALLATAIGLVAAIPAVIIYNHFSRVTKTYLELVSRASGAAGRLLSRDLDRTHGRFGTHSRAAE